MKTISPILSSEGTDTQCINQKAHLMSEQKQISPDWVAGLEGETVNCEDVTIRLSISLPILEGCLNVTCVQCENGKSISQIDSAQPTMANGYRLGSRASTRRQASISAARYSGYATAECYAPAHRRPCCAALGSQASRSGESVRRVDQASRSGDSEASQSGESVRRVGQATNESVSRVGLASRSGESVGRVGLPGWRIV